MNEHPSIAHPVGTWSETTYGDWGSQTITVRSCLRRDCDWSEVTRIGPDAHAAALAREATP